MGRVEAVLAPLRRERDLTPGTFTEHPDGRVTFEAVVERGGAPVLRLRAERTSAVTLRSAA